MRKFLLTLAITFGLLAPVMTFSPAMADCPAAGSTSSSGQVLSGIGENGGSCGNGETTVTSTISNIVAIISYFAGVVAIIMIIVAGIRYTTSGGDANKVGAAKSAILAAIIGLAIAALAQFMVHFVLESSNNVNKVCPGQPGVSDISPSCKNP